MTAIKERNQTLDIAKGISILLMTMSHLSSFVNYKNIVQINEVLVLFKMPLFIFISGYLFSDRLDFKSFFASKFDSLVKPIITIMIGTSIYLYFRFSYLNIGVGKPGGIGGAILDELTYIYGPLWFPIILFLTLILLKIVVRMSSGENRSYHLITFIGMIAVLDTFTRLGFHIHIMKFHALLYFLIIATAGFLTKKRNLQPAILNKITFLGSVILFTVLVMNRETLGIELNFNKNIFGDFIPTVLTFTTGIVIVLNISKLISRLPFISRFFVACSKHSLFILAFHIVIGNYFLYREYTSYIAPNIYSNALCIVLTIFLCCMIQKLVAKTRWLKYLLLPIKSFQGDKK